MKKRAFKVLDEADERKKKHLKEKVIEGEVEDLEKITWLSSSKATFELNNFTMFYRELYTLIPFIRNIKYDVKKVSNLIDHVSDGVYDLFKSDKTTFEYKIRTTNNTRINGENSSSKIPLNYMKKKVEHIGIQIRVEDENGKCILRNDHSYDNDRQSLELRFFANKSKYTAGEAEQMEKFKEHLIKYGFVVKK